MARKLGELVLSFHFVGPRMELKSSGVVASWVISTAPIITTLKIIILINISQLPYLLIVLKFSLAKQKQGSIPNQHWNWGKLDNTLLGGKQTPYD